MWRAAPRARVELVVPRADRDRFEWSCFLFGVFCDDPQVSNEMFGFKGGGSAQPLYSGRYVPINHTYTYTYTIPYTLHHTYTYTYTYTYSYTIVNHTYAYLTIPLPHTIPIPIPTPYMCCSMFAGVASTAAVVSAQLPDVPQRGLLLCVSFLPRETVPAIFLVCECLLNDIEIDYTENASFANFLRVNVF